MGRGVTWVQSYVTDDRLHCVYDAHNPRLITEHAARGGFRCDRIGEVQAVIDPESVR